MGTKKSPNFTM
jgi:hypothetical protein